MNNNKLICKIKCYPVFKTFLDILEQSEVVQMIQDSHRDILKNVASFGPQTHKSVLSGKKLSPTLF